MEFDPPCYLIVHNVSKRQNIGTLSRCATAFGVREMLLVGARKLNTFGAHGADAHVAMRHFDTIDECFAWVRARGIRLVGVEIAPRARSVVEAPFGVPTAFLMGNEGTGLSDKLIDACDELVYIPQHGQGTASLNVAVAAGIVLQRFAERAGYPERERADAKFVVAERPRPGSYRYDFGRKKNKGEEGAEGEAEAVENAEEEARGKKREAPEGGDAEKEA